MLLVLVFRVGGEECDSEAKRFVRRARAEEFQGVVLVPLVTPWGYLLDQYLKAPGDRWGKQVTVRSFPSDEPKFVTSSMA